MDLIAAGATLLFAALFIGTFIAWLRRRDVPSRDVMLIFASLGMLFVLAAVGAVVGELPTFMVGVAVALLLAQPLLTLRLAHRLHPAPRWVPATAVAAYLLTTLPLLVLPVGEMPFTVIPAVVVFIVTNLAAAWLLTLEAGRRAGAARVRIGAAALACALTALSVLVGAFGGMVPELATVAPGVGQVIVLAAAILFVLAFLPPPRVRRLWNAEATFDLTRQLTDVEVDADGTSAWNRFAELATQMTGVQAALVVAERDGTGRVVGFGGPPDVSQAASAVRLDGMPPRSTALGAGAGDPALAELGRLVGASYASVLPIEADEPMVLVMLSRRPSLFESDDHERLRSLGYVARVFAERARIAAEQAALAARLQETVAALERASQAKSDFLASMSHELRTPLSAIIGFSALMRDEQQVDGNRLVPDEWVEHVHSSGQHLLALINDVLDLTKIEAGRIDLELEDFELAAALSESMEGLRPLAERKALQLTLDAQPGRIRADRGRLRQIVYNLLSNAIKFTPQGGSISVAARWEGRDARVSVTDTGVGIAADDLERIFEEFSQVGDLKAREAGTGLGLALSRRLAQAHGGEIHVSSELGAGSRFEVVIPAARVGDQPEPSPEPAMVGNGGGASVLIIEDDPGAIRLLRTYLEADGYMVEVAPDGESGVARARAQLPDAIILDILLPGMDGWEVLRRLKSDPEVRDVPVVVVTVVDERNVAMSLGAVDYFLKPVQPEMLLSRLARYTFTTKVRERQVRVLAIDDDAAARQLVIDTLRREGFEVVAAGSGREALELAASDPPELVICDLLMPDMDGYEVVNRLRAAPATRDATILILTAHDLGPADRERLNGKVADVLEKGADLRPALRSWLARAADAARRRNAAATT